MARKRRKGRKSEKPGVIETEHRRRRSLYQLVAARSDIEAALQVASYAREHVTDIQNELWLPLQDALVMNYARPFTSNRPIGPLGNDWTRFADPRHQTLHGELISMRNQMVAHGDAARRQAVIYPPGAIPPVPGQEPPDGAAVAVITTRKEPSYFAEVEHLCEDLRNRLHTAAQALLQELFADARGVRPFNLMTGEEFSRPPEDAEVISTRPLPAPE